MSKEHKTARTATRLSLSGAMFIIGATAVVFAAARENLYVGIVVFFWLAPATVKTAIDISKRRFAAVKTGFVFLERLVFGLLSLGAFVVGSALTGFVLLMTIGLTGMVLLLASALIGAVVQPLFPQTDFSFVLTILPYGCAAGGLTIAALILKRLYEAQEIWIAAWQVQESQSLLDGIKEKPRKNSSQLPRP